MLHVVSLPRDLQRALRITSKLVDTTRDVRQLDMSLAGQLRLVVISSRYIGAVNRLPKRLKLAQSAIQPIAGELDAAGRDEGLVTCDLQFGNAFEVAILVANKTLELVRHALMQGDLPLRRADDLPALQAIMSSVGKRSVDDWEELKAMLIRQASRAADRRRPTATGFPNVGDQEPPAVESLAAPTAGDERTPNRGTYICSKYPLLLFAVRWDGTSNAELPSWFEPGKWSHVSQRTPMFDLHGEEFMDVGPARNIPDAWRQWLQYHIDRLEHFVGDGNVPAFDSYPGDPLIQNVLPIFDAMAREWPHYDPAEINPVKVVAAIKGLTLLEALRKIEQMFGEIYGEPSITGPDEWSFPDGGYSYQGKMYLLTGKHLDVLKRLVKASKRGLKLTIDSIADEVWPGYTPERSNIRGVISELNAVLLENHAHGRKGRFIPSSGRGRDAVWWLDMDCPGKKKTGKSRRKKNKRSSAR